MIDYEMDIFNAVATALRAQRPTDFSTPPETPQRGFITGDKVSAPAMFPCVSICEGGNSTNRNTQDTSNTENHADITIEIEVFSNRESGRKAHCRQVAAVVDDALLGLNFTKGMLESIPNADSRVHRMFGRYHATIGKDGQIYRK
jgi:hypothetical protein